MASSGRLWGGRFTEKPNNVFAEFNDSLRFDRRLFAADVRAGIAHAHAIERAGVIDAAERHSIVEGLTHMMEQEALNDQFFADSAAEDVHTFIESKLTDLIGETGRKLHTGRSRNDQVATAFRLWLRDEIDQTDVLLRQAQSSVLDFAERHEEAVLPGYTHLQRAQPVMFAHWCMAYFEMLKRDHERLVDVRKRVNIMPLGSGALAGAGFPIDRAAVAAELGFHGVSANSLDAVSDRDFAIEFAGACSLIMAHLSRLAEDMIIYCSAEFGFITLSDTVSSGSSLMPQKKNPDALELLRGKAGRIFGHNMSLLSMLKGLPLAYNKDMQEDKEAVFDTVDTVQISLRAASIVVDNASLNEERAREAAANGYLNATEFADYLVKKGVPFRTAHETVGNAVLYAISEGVELDQLDLKQLQEFSPLIESDIFDALAIVSALRARSSIGGTSPERVADAMAAARAYLAK